VGVLTRIWNAIRRPRRTVSSVELLQRAERCRREGRFEEGATLVREALRLEPRSTLAHLLAGYLHAALRDPAAADTAFRAALALDPEHPRAMLGLARIALERGDIGICRELLERALRVYPDFPEAHALLDTVSVMPAAVEPGAPSAAPTVARLSQVPRPEGSRECLLVRPDGSLIFAHPASATRDALGAHLARVVSLAGATLARAGLGPLRHGAVAANPGTTFLEADSRVVLALTLSPEVPVAEGQRQASELWKRFVAEGAG
jgi:tetratricopeptide (TPR) repeat protein